VGRRPASVGQRFGPSVEQLEARLPPAGHTIADAGTPVLGPLNASTVSGFLDSPNQVDLYRVSLGTGDRLVASVVARTAGSALDPILRVFTASGEQVAADKQEGGDPGLTFQAPRTDNYLVGVSSLGNADYDPTALVGRLGGTSRGTYALALSVRPATVNQALSADLAGSSFRLAETTAAWGEDVHPNFTVENRGGAGSGPFTVQLYVSPNELIDPATSIPLLSTPLTVSALAPGAEWAPTDPTVTLPSLAAASAAHLPSSGPLAIGIRITPADSSSDIGTVDKGGVHRGADWESLTLITPSAGGVSDLSQVDPTLNTRVEGTLSADPGDRYSITVGPSLGSGRFTVTATTDSGATVGLALYGGADGRTLLVQAQGSAGDPQTTLSQFLQPGTYFLTVTGDRVGEYRFTTTMTAASSPTQLVPTGIGASSVAVGDFNNDGRLDLVVANDQFASSTTLSVLMGNGDGTFAPTQTVVAGSDPGAVAVADVNGDGKPDLVVASSKGKGTAGAVVVLPGRGDGTFGPAQASPVGKGPVSVAVADLNGDGNPDLVVANLDDGTVGVLLGMGGGRFGSVVTFAAGTSPLRVAVADVNGDGIPDLVAADYTTPGTVAVLLGTGSGTFGPAHFLSVGPQPRGVVVADLNGDGKPDLITANSSSSDLTVPGTVSVLLGKGDGTFAPQTTYSVGEQPNALVVADLNGDGRPDIAVSNYNDTTLSYLLGNGDGTFVRQYVVQVPENAGGIAVADLNSDGRPDLVATNYGGNVSSNVLGSGVSVFLNNGGGFSEFSGQPFQPLGGAPNSLAVADFNGDGRLDVAAALINKQQVSVELGNGGGTFAPQVAIPVGRRPIAVATADLNDDGRADLVVANYEDNTVGVLLGNGDGTFRPEVAYAAGMGPAFVVLADVNGDGIKDIVVADNADDAVGVLWGKADGTFGPVHQYQVGTGLPTHKVGLSPGAGPITVAVADVNGDGVPDLVVTNSQDYTVDILLGAGNGVFVPQSVIPVAYAGYGLVVADVNGDKRPDLVLADNYLNTVGVLLANGDGTFQEERTFVAGNRPADLAVADFNGDGAPDIAVANINEQSAAILLGDGQGGFRAPTPYPAGAGPAAIAAADINNDGRPDVLVGNSTDNTLTALLNDGDGTFTSATATKSVSVPSTPHLVDLTGAVDAAGNPVLDSVILDQSGRILYRRRAPGGGNAFAPPEVLNPTQPARDVIPVQTPTGWELAAINRLPDPSRSTPRQQVYTVSLYALGADGRPEAPTVALSTSFLPTRIFAADLTGDGRSGDLVLTDSLNDRIQVARQRPDGRFGPLLTLSTGGSPSDVAFADVNHDHLLDIITSDQATGDATIFLNDPTHGFATSTRVRAGASQLAIEASSTISTVAGDQFQPYYGDGGPATGAELSNPSGLAVDAAGNLYIADSDDEAVRKVDAVTGVITTIAGSGVAGFSGDGKQATVAELNDPTGIAVDAAGNVYIADTNNQRIRKVDAVTGVITTVAGNGTAGYSGDDRPATSAELNNPAGLALDASGHLFIADPGNGRVRVVTLSSGTITTFAGGGTSTDDGAPATATALNGPDAVAVDTHGNVFIADPGNSNVREVDAVTGAITTVAGNGTDGDTGDGLAATSAELSGLDALAVDAAGNLFITDSNDDVVRMVDASTQIISTYAGTAVTGYFGDMGPATEALLDSPNAVAVNGNGDLFIADSTNNVIRAVSVQTGIITTFAGNGSARQIGDDGPAIAAQLNGPSDAAVDGAGDLFIADNSDNVIRAVSAQTGVITTVAGNGVAGYSGDGDLATRAELSSPSGIAVDGAGDLFIADSFNNVIRAVSGQTGIITTIAGRFSVQGGYSGDGGAATDALLNDPLAVAVDATGNVFFADNSNNVIREVLAATHTIVTYAGNGQSGASGDGGPAASAQLSDPQGVGVDAQGNLFIADTGNNKIREVAADTGVITTVAGTGTTGVLGVNGPATSAQLNGPESVAADTDGNLFIADTDANRILKVAAGTDTITVIGGNGVAGDSGDGGPAPSAQLDSPNAVTVDGAGNVFVADTVNNVIRQIALARTTIVSLTQTTGLTAGNFTGRSTDDGAADLLLVDRGLQSFSLLPNDGRGGFTIARPGLTTSTSDGRTINYAPGSVVAGDFHTRDGLDAARAGTDDVAVMMEDTGQVWIFTNNGAGVFRHTSSIAVGVGATGLLLADGPAPGLHNILVGYQSGDILTLVGKGDGTFQPVTLKGDRAPIQLTAMGTGAPVALVANQQTNHVTVQAPLIGGQYAPVKTLATSDPAAQLAPGDVNWAVLDHGSALADAIVVASGSNQLLVYRTRSAAGGTPVFDAPVSYFTGTDPVSVTVADINADGIPDMLIANKGSNDVSVLFGSYDPSGNWVGTPGPRLKSAGGPIAVNLVADSASPGGHDLAVTNQNGTINILPGRGQGFFDDRSPQAVALGSTLAQAPTFVPNSESGFAVTTAGALLGFNLADPTAPVSVVTVAGVLTARAFSDNQVVEVTAAGVEVVNPADTASTVDLFLLGGAGFSASRLPSDVAVLDRPDGLESLVTLQGSDTVLVFGTPVGAESPAFETQHDLAAADAPLALVSTLLTALPVQAGSAHADPGTGSQTLNPLFLATSTKSNTSAETLADAVQAAALLDPFQRGDPPEDESAGSAPDEYQGLVTGTAEGLRRLLDEVRKGKRNEGEPGANPGVNELLKRVLGGALETPADPVPNKNESEAVAPKGENTESKAVPARPAERVPAVGSSSQLPTDVSDPIIELWMERGGTDSNEQFVAASGDGSDSGSREGGVSVQFAGDGQRGAEENRSVLEGASPFLLLALVPALLDGSGDRCKTFLI
jgi:hypothetical protein